MIQLYQNRLAVSLTQLTNPNPNAIIIHSLPPNPEASKRCVSKPLSLATCQHDPKAISRSDRRWSCPTTSTP
eukprot:1029369-Amphidinium_carterae.2